MKKIILTALSMPLSLKALEVTDHNTFLETTLKAEAQAEDANQAKAYLLSAGVGFMYFDYKEKLDGPLKSNESGSLPFMKIEGEELVFLLYPDRELALDPVYFHKYRPGFDKEIIGRYRIGNKYRTLSQRGIAV